ncbi:hypothetical protein FRC11_013817 [Ceratobasidium sp. 423]|nr:hypothetical protein FRC11_013817 [Ceratobasidium sp. 423]
MTHSARDIVNSHLANTQADSDAHPGNTEHTGNESTGLYDFPPNDPRSWANRTSEEATRRKSNNTRARNHSLRRTQGRKSASQHRSADGGPERAEPDRSNAEPVPGAGRRRATRQCGRSQTTRILSALPPPASAGNQPGQPIQSPAESQYTYEYQTLNHEGLVAYAKEEFGLDVQGCDTQTIIRRLQLAEAEQTAEVGLSRRSASILVLSPTPFQVGGGWSQDVVGSQPSGLSKKRPSATSGLSDSSSKRQCAEIVVDNTETETESDDTATESETDTDDNRVPPRAAPLPMNDATPATVLDSQPSTASSHSLGGSIPPPRAPASREPLSQDDTPTPKLPNLIAPVCGPIHTRLRSTLLQCFLDHMDRAAEAAEEAQAQAPNANDQPSDGDRAADVDEVPETEFGSTPNASQRATLGSSSTLRTYGGPRSHLPPDPEAPAERMTPSRLIRRERARVVAAKVRADMAKMAPGHRRSCLFATASRDPAAHPQARPPLGARSNAVGQCMGSPRRLNPVSAARADMVAFNRAVAQGEVTSLAESVRRQSQRTARCAPPASRPLDELLDDDEEMLAQAEAYAKGKWPHRSRIRKPKPLAQDVSGIERQVLVMAKVHLFTFALVEGIYQTRTTFLRWASAIHHATWQMELPGRPYTQPDNDIFEILVNNIVTLRGKAKERLREFVARVSGFNQNLLKQEEILKNLACFNELYPNSFHCKSSSPRYGDYEHPEIAHCIALVVFYGPNSVGVMYPDYFRDMPLTVVAFALAIWQFCIEEWLNGWRQNGDLGMGAMCEKYKAQLAGLKALHDAAPRRMSRLQNHWQDYVAQYSGAVFDPEEVNDVEPTRQYSMRPDTPEPDNAISVEEMDTCLLETTCQNSLRSHMEEIAAQELAQPTDINEGDLEGSQAPTSHSPSPPLDERNEHGVLTAYAKGKGRAN